LELEALLLCGPDNRGFGAEESAFELLRTVFNFSRRDGTVPFNIERDFRANGKHPRERRVHPNDGKSQPLRQGIGEVMVVENIHATHAKASARVVKVHLHGIVPHRDHPEYVAPVNMHVVVVDLVIKAKGAGRSNRTGVKVKSNKGKRASMLLAVRTDELALAETHVRLECEPVPGAHVCSPSSYVRQAHEPVEIRDLRRIADIS
jgi:hypothetical protein